MNFRTPLHGLLTRLASLAAAFALAACGPTLDDDDDSTPEVTGRVTVQPGGMVFDSIQEAIDAAAEGATITVSAGTYEESLEIRKALTISGENAEQTLVTGAGDGTIVAIDQVAGSLQLSGLSLVAPPDEPGTIRGLRITDASDVLLHDLRVGFDDRGSTGECVHGLVGVEVSGSTVVMSETYVYCVGFTSETGGTGVLSQTGSDLTVLDSSVGAVGSFGIRSLASSLTVVDTSVTSINRPPSAEQYESDGTGIFIEQSNEEVTLDRVVVSGGSFVGVWMEGPSLTVTNSDISNFAYGVYLPGDSAIASGRQLVVTGSSFSDILQEAVLSVASTTVTGSTFRTNGLLVDPNTGGGYSGVRIIAPNGEAIVNSSVFENLGVRGVTVVGNNDGNVANVNLSYNTVTGVAAGNGLLVSDADSVVMEGNIVTGIDHAFFDDDGGSNAGAITNGFGMACFRATSCTLSGNDVSDSEFSNVVVHTSNFTSTDDVIWDGWGRGLQAESSQGTITNPTFENNRGVGLVMISSTIVGTGGVFRGHVRGPNFQDLDGVNDPLPEDMLEVQGGRAIESLSGGFLSWSDGLFENNIQGGVYTSQGQFEFSGNRLTNNGYDDLETGMGGGAAIVVSGSDPLALSGPLVSNNIVDGCEGSWAVSVTQSPGVLVENNTVCGGESAGIYLTGSDGAVVSGNSLGTSEDSTVTNCADIDWSYGLYLMGPDLELVDEGVRVTDNAIIPAAATYGIYIIGVGSFDLDGNHVVGGSVAAVSAGLTLPNGLTWDDDGDGQAEYQGDCDDTNPQVGGAGALELEGDGLDNDCDPSTTDGASSSDLDGDGYTTAEGDCNDFDAAVHPAATEVVGNSRDDNCDGWAEFDGEFPMPSLTFVANQLESAGTGIRLYGGSVVMPAVAAGETPNRIDGSTSDGIYLDTWTWAGTPASGPSSLVMGAGNVISDSSESCVHIVGEGGHAELDQVTLERCGHWGLYLSGDGSADLTTVVAEEPGFSGIRMLNGAATLDGFEVDTPGNSGIEVLGGALSASAVDINDAAASALVVMGGSAAIDGMVANYIDGAGVSISGGATVLSNAAVAGAVAAGVSVTAGELTMTGGSVSNSGQAGVEASAGTLTVSGTSIFANSGDGVLLSGTVQASLTDASLSDNGGFGLSCDGDVSDLSSSSVALVACSADTTGNASGDFTQINGCELEVSCAAPVSGGS